MLYRLAGRDLTKPHQRNPQTSVLSCTVAVSGRPTKLLVSYRRRNAPLLCAPVAIEAAFPHATQRQTTSHLSSCRSRRGPSLIGWAHQGLLQRNQ